MRVNDAQNMCSSTMLCCSRTADPSSWSSTCHFLGAGGYSSNTGNLYEGRSTHRGIITSRFNMHTRLHTHRHTNTSPLTLRTRKIHCADVFWQLNRVCTFICAGCNQTAHYKTTLKHVTRPIRKIDSTSSFPWKKVNGSVLLDNQNIPHAAHC